MIELRASIFIDQLQPQTLAYLSTWMRGTPPRLRMAAHIFEIAPGLDVEALTDVVLKHAEVRVGLLVVERQFGTLQFHSYSTAEIHAGSSAILEALDQTSNDVIKPKILASKLVTNIDPQHAFLMNRNKLGSMVIGGDSVYLLECQSAAFAILACNEAEKEADIKVIDMRMIGSHGRLYLAGTEADVRNALNAAERALRDAGAV
ncbi:MAG: BMC domain-containing protein [Aestuariivita sp.]|nr:BMC domain-containing protein [Aestuariivita sp.]MCY4202319.1 BMC domain-containing protein [Aestuariivita sp.]MCY4289928.1 BMC domain-containing protein [Aestuariivita sp.]MCY4346763.1 BMC domain-containing protein [Aestuariivita sp.]